MSIDFSDQNLLFAIVMLRNGFVDEEQFVQVLNQWSENKGKHVSDLVISNGWIEELDASAIDRLVQRQIQKHGDIEQSISHHAQTMDFTSCQLADKTVRDLLDSTYRSAATKRDNTRNEDTSKTNVETTATSVSQGLTKKEIAAKNGPKPAGSKSESSPNLSMTLPSDSGSVDVSSSGIDLGRAPKPPTRFAVLRPHAEGGLGKVSVALDTELDREVALKEIRTRFVDDQISRDRFVLEACITGGLEHPGVVPVYGFGQKSDGSPYFAMRLIKGQTLKEAVRNYHEKFGDKDLLEKRLEFRNLLSRFVDSCNAVAYAHNRGVIHRDIKPSNIMLGKYGETLVVDWGLAKKFGRDIDQVDEDASLAIHGNAISGTLDGSTVGTPTFMSPEQAMGRLDEMRPASDIYSLGSTLYFILTGKTAFTGSNANDVVALVCENNFVPPRERNSQVPAALNSICCKAMSTRPGDRYKTALMLAADIENWMADEPVAAHRESLLARTGRWLRHHKTLATSAAVLALTVTVASLVGMMMVNAEKNRTVAALNLVSAEKEKTEQALAAETSARRQTREVLNTITDDLVGELMARQVELGDTDKAFFSRVLNQFEEFTSARGESAEAMNIRADGYFRVGNLQRRLDDLDGAAKAYGKAETIWTSLADSSADPNYRRDLAAVNANHAILLAQLGQHEQAIAKENKAVDLLENLMVEFPQQPIYKIEYASLLGNRGNAFARTRQVQKAEKDYQKSIELYKSLALDTDDPKVKKEYAQAVSFLAGLYAKQQDRLADAESLYQTVIDQLSELVSANNSQPEFERQLAIAQQNLGNVLVRQNRKDEAVDQFRSAVTTQVSLTNKYPALAAYRRDLGRSRLGLGQALTQLGLEGSEKELLAAKAISDDLTAEFPERIEFKRDLANVYDRLGAHYRKSDRPKATDMYQRGLDLRLNMEKLEPENKVYSDHAIAAEINFANFLRLSDETENAATRYQSVLTKLDAREEAEANLVRATVFGLGDSLVKAQRYEDALKCWTRLTSNKKDPAWKTFELQRAICTVRTGDIDAGVNAAETTLLLEKPNGVTYYDVGCCLAVAAEKEKDKSKAEVYAKRAVELIGLAGKADFFDEEMQMHASSDIDLNSLRSRDDFKQVCTEYGVPLEPVTAAPKDGF